MDIYTLKVAGSSDHLSNHPLIPGGSMPVKKKAVKKAAKPAKKVAKKAAKKGAKSK